MQTLKRFRIRTQKRIDKTPMRFYFSGIAGKQEYQMLEKAEIKRILVDHRDIVNIPETRRIDMLDSGAYRAYKAGRSIDLDIYLQTVAGVIDRVDTVVAPDVIGDPESSYRNWEIVRNSIPAEKLVPVWQWQSSKEHLKRYLDNSKVVGIGGLAIIMRAGDKTPDQLKLREKVLSELIALCAEFPHRFHIFGLNYLKGIEALASTARSADASVWLRGGRYGFVVFKHKVNGHLTQAPARCIPEYQSFDREKRCIVSASEIENYLGLEQ